uniref:ABC transmembrane type-1 domain-containing protein n=1 Tax=Ascaris lumbricoides TaxID=6252 RepID=A0A0M3HL11_ASCLU
MAGARMNAIYFSILGICAGIATFTGGFLFGWAGESLTSRLRLKLFRHILRQVDSFILFIDFCPGTRRVRGWKGKRGKGNRVGGGTDKLVDSYTAFS